MPVTLTKFVREEIEHYREHESTYIKSDLDDGEVENAAARTRLVGIYDALLTGQRDLTADECRTIEPELHSVSDCYDGKWLREWEDLMAALGLLDRYDPKVQYSRRPKTRVISGVRYIVG